MAVDFFKSHPWQPDEEDWWCFHVIFDDQPQVADYAGAYHPALKHPSLYPPIEAKWLHMTMLAIAPSSKVSQTEMEQIVTLLKPWLNNLRLSEFVLGPWWLWRGGNPVLHVTSEESLIAIFDQLSAAVKKVIGERGPQPEQFIPHITLAYNRDHDQALEIHRRLSTVTVRPVKFHVRELTLLKQRQVPPQYVWEVVEKLPIGQA